MVGLWQVVALVAVGVVDAYGYAAEMAQAARRFRELNPHTVKSQVDKRRNTEWHRAGGLVRAKGALYVAALAAVTWGHGSPWAFASAFLLVGSTVMLAFDILFNVKAGMPGALHVGTTAKLDLLSTKFGRWEYAEAAVVIIGAIGWWLARK